MPDATQRDKDGEDHPEEKSREHNVPVRVTITGFPDGRLYPGALFRRDVPVLEHRDEGLQVKTRFLKTYGKSFLGPSHRNIG